MGKIFDFILRAVNFRVIGTTDEIVGKMHKHGMHILDYYVAMVKRVSQAPQDR